MKRLPISWLTVLFTLAILGSLIGLAWFGVIDLTGDVFAALNVVVLALVFVFAVLGGAFAGTLMTHRMLSNREFSPVERTVLETHAEVRALGKRLAAIEEALAKEPPREPPKRV